MMDWNNDLAVLVRVGLAIVLGGVVGFEREAARKPAGLRTHMLVAGAAALLVALGNLLVGRFAQEANLNSDPIRILEAIVVGVSFLGAGTIFRREGTDVVEGLTTGASLLFTAAIAVGVALEQYVLCAGATVLVLLINRGLMFVDSVLGTPS
jgi:putative Mg2+ transporter-C (MgtC) family protein